VVVDRELFLFVTSSLSRP